MKRISEQEYRQELAKVDEEYKALNKRRVADADYSNQLLKELNEKRDLVTAIEDLIDNHTSYSYFKGEYNKVLEYFKEKGFDELTDDIERRKKFLEENYCNNDIPELENFYLSDTVYANDDDYYEELSEDAERAMDYFKEQNRNYVFSWELEHLVLVLFGLKITGESLDSIIPGPMEDNEDHELNRIKRDFAYLLNELEEENELDISLFLWSIYNTYHYFYKKDNEFFFEKPSFALINYLLDICLYFFRGARITLVDNENTDTNIYFFERMCGLLSNDLIHAIMDNFPNYYDDMIIFLGNGCYQPAGTSALTTCLKSFDSFVNGIKDYDLWIEPGESGEEIISKLNIEKDYDKLEKQLFGE